MNYKIVLSYDGTRYFGWQKTKTGPSIQENLEKALFQILRIPVPTEAASRTDRGVHAEGQVVNFFLSTPAPPSRLLYSLNAVLPPDIRARSIEEMPNDFHPTLSALSKEYRYHICNEAVQYPRERLYSWHIHEPLDLTAMQFAAQHLLGTHNFASFTTIEIEDTMRTLFDVQILPLANGKLQIRIAGDRFLYKMMRRLVGTIVAVGKRTMSEKDVLTLLKSPNRAQAGVTAPAHGLTLHQIHYSRELL